MQGTTSGSTGGSMMDRLMGIITFKAPVYRQVADDTTATGQAATIVIIVAVVTGVVSGAIASSQGTGTLIGTLISSLINTLLGWLLGSVLLAWVSKQFFNGKTDTGEMLRVTGFASIFNLLQIIPIIGVLLAFILWAIAWIIGIREAAEISTAQAIGTAIITLVVVLVVVVVIALILGLLFAGLFAGATAITGK